MYQLFFLVSLGLYNNYSNSTSPPFHPSLLSTYCVFLRTVPPSDIMTDHFQSRSNQFICAFFTMAHCLIWTMVCLNIILMVWHLTRPNENTHDTQKHFLRLIVKSKRQNLGDHVIDSEEFLESWFAKVLYCALQSTTNMGLPSPIRTFSQYFEIFLFFIILLFFFIYLFFVSKILLSD